MSASTVRRLSWSDRDEVMAIVNERVEDGCTLFDGKTEIKDLQMTKELHNRSIYHHQHIYGLFREGKLRVFTILRPVVESHYGYMNLMVLSEINKDAIRGVVTRGLLKVYNEDTQLLLTEATRAMEQKGYYIVYSVRPKGKHWARYADNPGRDIKGEYESTVLETIPAGQYPKSALARSFLGRTYDVELELTQYRRTQGRAVQQ